MVHQHFSLVPRMTVVENLMLGQVRGVLKRHEFGARIRDIAESFGFTLDPEAVVGELSVGERQRAEIVKCLMRDPKLLVLDEPTAVLPPGEIGALLDICRRVADSGRAVILVTHKLAEIAKVADRVAVLRTGRLVADESMAGRRHGRAGPRHGRPRAAGRSTWRWPRPTSAPRCGRRVRRRASPWSATASRCTTATAPCGSTTSPWKSVPARSSAWPASRATARASSAWCWPACCGRPKVASIIGGTDLTHAGAAAVTAAGGGIVPEDRHAVACVTAMSVAENMFLNKLDRLHALRPAAARRAERGGADSRCASSTCAPPAPRSPSPA